MKLNPSHARGATEESSIKNKGFLQMRTEFRKGHLEKAEYKK
jgi:hypothetical protein